MKKRIQEYIKYIDAILADTENDYDWDREMEKHLVQVSFFQHERLVHLLVFMLVAICTVMCILAFIIKGDIVIVPLIVLLFILLVPYCMHYYLLENSVQKMYDQYDEMMSRKEKCFKV